MVGLELETIFGYCWSLQDDQNLGNTDLVLDMMINTCGALGQQSSSQADSATNGRDVEVMWCFPRPNLFLVDLVIHGV